MLAEILEKIAVYVANHFKTEEDLMVKYSYPDYKVHKEAHDDLKEQAGKLIKLFGLKKVDLTATVTQFLSDWLQNHIKDTDMRFIEWLRGKKD
jgi:hemerythrin-like metal-binding protein